MGEREDVGVRVPPKGREGVPEVLRVVEMEDRGVREAVAL